MQNCRFAAENHALFQIWNKNKTGSRSRPPTATVTLYSAWPGFACNTRTFQRLSPAVITTV